MIDKSALTDALTMYRETQLRIDSANFASKDEMRGYINRIEQVDDGIIFFDGNGKAVAKIPAMIKNPNLHGGD